MVRVLIALLLLLAGCAEHVSEAADEQLARQQSFLADLVEENTGLRTENARLRELLLQHETLILSQNETLRSTLEELRAQRNPRPTLRPSARIPVTDVRITDDQVVIDVPGAVPVLLADTGSMEPFADNTSKIIAIEPEDERDVRLGDIVGYRCAHCNGTIILHRVVAIGRDRGGMFYILQGDSNPVPDPERVRFAQVATVVVGVIY